jgi:hypothetical protein
MMKAGEITGKEKRAKVAWGSSEANAAECIQTSNYETGPILGN